MDYNKFNLIPDKVGLKGICCFGEHPEIQGFKKEYKDGFSNFIFTEKSDFQDFILFKYLDGFSPNLNKKLHIGHFSNLVNAKAFKNLNICKKTIAIYGDTLDNTDYDNENYHNFGYFPDKIYYASQIKLKDESILLNGINKYEGTKVFKIGKNYQVGVKSNGKTSYFYQDIALIQELNAPTLYLTGFEQNNHFKILNEFSSNVNHIGLGLVTLQGSKMSSREGNVIFMNDFIKEINQEFNNLDLTYNIASSFILKTNPKTKKNIDLSIIKDYNQNLGLYISYSMARLSNLPIKFENKSISSDIKFMYLKSKYSLNPSILFNYLLKICQNFNSDYSKLKSQDNINIYSQYFSNIRFCQEKLGLYWINNI